jgi:hypothetical protein
LNFCKKVVPHLKNGRKTGTIERFIWKKFGEMGFSDKYRRYGGLNLDLFWLFLEELQN